MKQASFPMVLSNKVGMIIDSEDCTSLNSASTVPPFIFSGWLPGLTTHIGMVLLIGVTRVFGMTTISLIGSTNSAGAWAISFGTLAEINHPDLGLIVTEVRTRALWAAFWFSTVFMLFVFVLFKKVIPRLGQSVKVTGNLTPSI